MLYDRKKKANAVEGELFNKSLIVEEINWMLHSGQSILKGCVTTAWLSGMTKGYLVTLVQNKLLYLMFRNPFFPIEGTDVS